MEILRGAVEVTANIPAEVGQATQLNESVFELYSAPGKASMEVLFFHGFQDGDYQNAHIDAWKCRDGSAIWPQTWLVEQFPDARILCVSYNYSLITSAESGMIDMDIISENLISDLLSAKIGQARCRPVVLVGHSFGGLVIKHMCVFVSSTTGRLKRNSEQSVQLSTFLGNVSRVFFYSTPHQGMLDSVAEDFLPKGPLLDYVKILSTSGARVHSNFDNLHGQGGPYKMWQIAGLGEGCRTKRKRGKFNHVVEEASARYGATFNIVEGADHVTVCRPPKKTCRSFSALENFLKGVADHSKAMVYGLPDYPTALERRAFEVQQKLTSSPVVGIVGMGGIGKTTIAKKLFNNISREFEYTCFVENVKGIPGYKLKDWTLNQFLRNGRRVDQNSLQWSDLEKMKTLVMMDNVDSETQVRTVPRLNEFGNDSRVVFTTRDRGVLHTSPKCEIYEVISLNLDESKTLFCQHAFEQEGIPHTLVEVNAHLEESVKKVVEKCGGLPLTLEVLGSYLRCDKTNATVWDGHKTNDVVWKQTLDKLGRAQPVNGVRKDRLWDSLRVSYDALLPEEQGMFIEAGIYFFQQPVERALVAWSTAYGDSETRWANLLRTSMVKEVDRSGWDRDLRKDIRYKMVWVHEHMRDLAKNILGGVMLFSSWYTNLNKKEVGAETSILCLGSKVSRGYFQFQVSLLMEGLMKTLRGQDEDEDEDEDQELFQVELLDTLENLKYLELFDILPGGSTKNLLQRLSVLTWRLRAGYSKLLPFSLEHMKNLAVLELENWQIQEEGLQTLGSLRNLRILSLSRLKGLVFLPENFGYLSQLKRLELRDMELTGLPESFGYLAALKHLVLFGCKELVELPESFGQLSALQELHLSRCERLERLPDNFGQLLALCKLDLSGCEGLERLPDNFGQLFALQELHLSECERLERLPDNFGKLSALQELHLSRCERLERLPDNFGQLLALCKLDLSECERLERLPDNFGKLSALQELHLSECERLERLPDNFGQLSALQELHLSRCERLERLPDNFGQLSALQKLHFARCEQLERLPDNFGQLLALCKLDLSECERLERLPDNFGQLSALQELHLSECERLERLPGNFGKLLALQELHLSRCERLEQLPDNFGQLPALQELHLSRCERLERLPDNFGQLLALCKLDLSGCERLERLPDNFGQLSALQELHLSECEQLERLPDNFGKLSALQELHLSRCERLERLPDNFGKLSALQELHLSECERLERLPDNFGQLSALQELHLYRCERLERLLDNFGQLLALCKLDLSGCERLERLPDNFGQLLALRKLDLWGCKRLERLPNIFGQLSALRKLDLSECERLERLPDNFSQLSALQELHLLECERLERLPDNFGKLSALQELHLSRCERLERLPDNFGQLSALQKLHFARCERLERLPDNFGQLSALQELHLSRCERLERLPDNFGQLLALCKLDLSGCERLQRLPDNFGQLSALRELDLSGCERLERLPDNFGQLSALEKLTLGETIIGVLQSFTQLHALRELCVLDARLHSLPEELGSLSSLEVLQIEECESLGILPDSLGRISCLREVVLLDCSGLSSLPDSLGSGVWCDGDRGRSVDGQSPKNSSTKGLLLFIKRCPGLDVSLLRGFTRVKDGDYKTRGDSYGLLVEWDLVVQLVTEELDLDGHELDHRDSVLEDKSATGVIQ